MFGNQDSRQGAAVYKPPTNKDGELEIAAP
jgi:hypothetical protein